MSNHGGRYDDYSQSLSNGNQSEQLLYSRGDELAVTVLHHSGYHLKVKVVGHEKQGKVKVPYNTDIEVGQTIKVYVLGENPKSKLLTLSLKKQSKGQSSRHQNYGQKTESDLTINRLNKLFSTTDRTVANQERKKIRQA